MPAANTAFRDPAYRGTVAIVAGALALVVFVVVAAVSVVSGQSWLIGLPVAVLATLGIVVVWTSGANSRVFSQLRLGTAVECDDARLVNLVEGLSLSIGTEEPDLYVITDDAMNGLSLVSSEGASVVVTSGLLESLGRLELEGVVAQLLVKIKSGEADLATAVAGTFGYPFLDGSLAFLGPTVGSWAMNRIVKADADLAADRSAVGVTRYPPGLGSALAKISDSFSPTLATRGNDHLWIAPPLTTEAAIPHSPLEWRVDILLEF